MKGKKRFALLLSCSMLLAFSLIFGNYSYANSIAPIIETLGDVEYIFANGVSLTIEERTDGNAGALVKWDGGSCVVGPDAAILGGSHNDTTVIESANIKMTGGTVGSVAGGGFGETKDKTTTVKDVTIELKNATITNNVCGGGYAFSKVGNTSITVENCEFTKTSCAGIVAGGIAYTRIPDVGTYFVEEQDTLSGNVVENTELLVNNVKIHGPGTIYGGGQGNSYVKKSQITLDGKNTLVPYLTTGGSTGVLDEGSITIKDGTINVLQSVNRGYIGKSTIVIKDGTVKNAYVGGEAEDTTVTGEIKEISTLDITGGTIESLKAGTNSGVVMKAGNDKMVVFYNEASVNNSNEIESLLGASAKKYNPTKSIVEDKVVKDKVISSDELETIKENNKTYALKVQKSNGENYTWTFKGSDIKDPTIQINSEIKLLNEVPSQQPKLNEKVTDLKDAIYLVFTHEGDLPGKALITYDVGDKYKDGTVLYVRHYNESDDKLEQPVKCVVNNGLIEFSITTCSTYVVSTTGNATQTPATENIENPDTYDGILVSVGVGTVALAGIIALTYVKMRKERI